MRSMDRLTLNVPFGRSAQASYKIKVTGTSDWSMHRWKSESKIVMIQLGVP